MTTTRYEWSGDDPAALAATLRALAPDLSDVSADVADVIARVREGGDAALAELSERFDGVRPRTLRVDDAECEQALAGIDAELREALDLAAANIRAVAEAQAPAGQERVELAQGQSVTVGEAPVGSAGVYAPGGRAAYPSTVLMCALPARAAGVERIAVASPPGEDGLPSRLVLAACALCGVDEVYAVGGAQAMAALALGTETIKPVDVVAGPGSRYVTEAKRQLAGRVGIDAIAGPTELMVVLGEEGDEWAALDLCAQAEHGDDGLLVACSVESEVLDRLAQRVAEISAERDSVADPALALVQVPDTDAALALANELAPEHLQLATEDAELMAPAARSAGCVFVGPSAGAAFGDYAAGSNHVLPTGGAGRFSGPLSPATFTRRTSTVSLPPEAAKALAPHVDALARAEGFPVHGESAKARQ